MPAVIGLVFFLFIIAIVIGYLLPLAVISLSTTLTGRQGRFDDKQITRLQIWFYASAGFLFGLIGASENSDGVFSFIFNFLFAFFTWPLGLSVGALTAFGGKQEDIMLVLGCIFLSYVFVQLMAVKMILDRTRNETELDLD